MFYYIDHPWTPSFTIGLVESESELLISWDCMREMNRCCCDSSEQFWCFLAFSDLTCHLQDTGLGFFACHIMLVTVSTAISSVFCIFLRSLGVICFAKWVLSECHKNYFKDWCLMNLHPISPVFTSLTQWNGHVI